MSGAGRGPGPPGLEGLVEAALAEDVGEGDRTTEWTVPAGAAGRARIVAREPGRAAGLRVAGRVFRQLDGRTEVTWRTEEGGGLAAGDTVAEISGPLRAILTGERVALNFLGRLSGIATLTARFVEAVEGTGCRVTDTRKTTPGWRRLEKEAVAAGGGQNHRMGLFDMVLLKENHLRAAGGVAAALGAVRGPAGEAGLAVEVEVTDLEELEAALERPPDRILLDNMTAPELREAVERAGRLASRDRPLLEASGGVTLENVREVAETGVDLVSVGALTHSASALDLSLLLEEA